MLTHAYWARRFGGDPSVLGRAVIIDGASTRSSACCEPTRARSNATSRSSPPARWPTPTRKGPFFRWRSGRLRPGVSPTAAAETLRATNARLFPIWRSSYQNENATWGLLDLKSRVVGDVGSTLGLRAGGGRRACC